MSFIKTLKTATVVAALLLATELHAAQYLERTPRQNERAFSPAVITEGGKMIWLAGHGGLVEEEGKSNAGNFESQAREAFAAIEKTLKRAGGSLENIVYMTVFIKDVRHGEDFVKIRREMFPKGNFPGSTLVTTLASRVPACCLRSPLSR